MASEKPDKKEKKDKKDKREKKVGEDGVKKAKKDKKEKKKDKAKLAAALDEHLQSDVAGQAAASGVAGVVKDGETEESTKAVAAVTPILVPFAVPIADDKNLKKVIKMVRRAAKANVLKRGVKEVVKTLRKSSLATPTNRSFEGVVVIAGDISPPDVVSHLPVLCEDHNVPYIFVPLRAELGSAAKTKRPTSVVMIMEKAETRRGGDAGKTIKAKEEVKDDDEGGDSYADAYAALVRIVEKETARQAHWIKGE